MDSGLTGGNLDALLQERAEDVATLRNLVQDVLQPEHDDIWLLRFLLSNGSPAASQEPIRFTIKWRAERAEALAKVRTGANAPHYDQVSKYQVAGDHKYTSLGEPIFIVRIGLCNPRALMDNVPYNDVVDYMMLSRESTLLYLDAKSRETRTLIKVITVLDFANFSLLRGNDSRFSKVLGDTSKLSEKMYPQLLGRTVFVNTPAIFTWCLKLIKPLMSEKSVAKMVFCPGGKRLGDCPFVSMYLPLPDLPSFLGGACTCGGRGCIGGIPNSQTTPVNAIDDDGLASMTVAARSVQSLDVALTKGCVLEYSIGVTGKRVKVSVVFKGAGGVAMVLPKQFLEAAAGLVEGMWSAPEDGIASVVFDTSDAVFRGREVKYKVNVVDEPSAP
ncbi:hypothetical protein ACHHYP_13093 [Achlya hypogyna]|uniref:CRAL-TRIO domain-containing protein n=1 Tax=Achlya hypogyna TaxID=1202772 RepID=A0A1V9YG16_ACHHY|nr:hypothetical protein ACHHYP_13093 [Achlya hypogyna]